MLPMPPPSPTESPIPDGLRTALEWISGVGNVAVAAVTLFAPLRRVEEFMLLAFGVGAMLVWFDRRRRGTKRLGLYDATVLALLLSFVLRFSGWFGSQIM